MKFTRKVANRKHIGRMAALSFPFEFQLQDFHIHLHEGEEMCFTLDLLCMFVVALHSGFNKGADCLKI